jgi:osmotically-inducible protein OsmY
MSADSLLQLAVQAELSWVPNVTAAHLGVAARDGVVTLTGHVGSYFEKDAAEAAVSRVAGVKAIAEEIEIKLSTDMKRTDDQIADAALKSLSWDVSVPHDKVTIKVEKGWVTLNGEVKWHFEKEAAADNCRRLYGVVGISNLIRIASERLTSDVHEKIMSALHRSWYDTADITVRAEGGRVSLGGSVRNRHERRLAEDAAWSAPGISEIEDNIVIV